MIRFILPILLLFQYSCVNAQAKPADFTGSWVKVGLRYYSGEELPSTHVLKHQYFKIKFTPNQKAFKSLDATVDGTPFDYSIHRKGLTIGYLEYTYDFSSKKDTLVLMEHYEGRLIDQSYVYVFIREEKFQDAMPLQKNMYFLRKRDTVFLESQKIYPTFTKSDEDFHSFLLSNVSSPKDKRNHPLLIASFIITEKGKIDSITIQRSINSKFDSQFKRALMESEKYWTPAIYKGKAVPVQKTHKLQFLSSPKMMVIMENYPLAIEEMQQGNYHLAISLFSRCLNAYPNDKDSLFKRAICYLQLNQPEMACEDWLALKQLDDDRVDQLIATHCK